MNYKNQFKDPLLLDFGSRNATENFNFSFGERTEVWRSCSTVFKARVSVYNLWGFLENENTLVKARCLYLVDAQICLPWEGNKSAELSQGSMDYRSLALVKLDLYTRSDRAGLWGLEFSLMM